MKLCTRALVASAAALGLVLAGATAASAAPLPTDVRVSFADSAPAPGATIRDTVTLSGRAQAIEGVRRVELFAVAHRPAGRVPTGRPIATTVYEVPGTDTTWAFTWSPAGALRVVDVVVVARTSTRSGQAEIAGVTVGAAVAPRPAPRPAPAPAPRPAAAVGAAGAGAVTGAAAVPKPAPGPAVRAGAAVDVSVEQATAFYQAYSQTAYETEVIEPAAPRSRVTLPSRGGRQVPWSAFGIGTLLLACAAQAMRMSRPRPEPAYA